MGAVMMMSWMSRTGPARTSSSPARAGWMRSKNGAVIGIGLSTFLAFAFQYFRQAARVNSTRWSQSSTPSLLVVAASARHPAMNPTQQIVKTEPGLKVKLPASTPTFSAVFLLQFSLSHVVLLELLATFSCAPFPG